jgi:hypothetical protein
MAANRPLLIVASCTQLKTRPVAPSLRLRRIAGAAGVATRAEKWRETLSTHSSETLPAASLYAGAFWSVIKKLPDIARSRGFRPQLLVASAGYGLVSEEARLQPYSATFASGHDSVVRTFGDRQAKTTTLRTWWRLLAAWKGPRGHVGPRTLEGFAKQARDSSILVIASPEYVTAMSEDLSQTAQALQNPERLAIVSSVSGFPAELTAHLVPSVAALQRRLGGPLGSLHARTAKRLLEIAEPPLNAATLAAKTRRLAREAPPRRAPKRASRTDQEVQSFIRRRTRSVDHPGCSKLLREYRDGGSKCEHSRFRSLFNEVTQQRKAS